MFGEKKKKERQNEEKEKSSGKAKCAGGVYASPYAPRSSFVTFLLSWNTSKNVEIPRDSRGRLTDSGLAGQEQTCCGDWRRRGQF
jgi:hypothetical protein